MIGEKDKAEPPTVPCQQRVLQLVYSVFCSFFIYGAFLFTLALKSSEWLFL
jgi:hypothetical protein